MADKTPFALKEKVTKITIHSGVSEDFSFEWEELVFTYASGEEELVSQISTSSDSPEDNTLSRIGSHDILACIQATEVNSKMLFEEKYHENSDGYLNT